MLSIERYSYRTEKIAFITEEELVDGINGLGASKLISITNCTPDRTDTRQWVSVYYEFQD